MRLVRFVVKSLIVIVIMLEVVVYLHARMFTQYGDSGTQIKKTEYYSFKEKISLLLATMQYQRPQCERSSYSYAIDDRIGADSSIAITRFEPANSLGTVLIFPGYQRNRWSVFEEAKKIYESQYNVVTVDFHGTGCSTGSKCSIGYNEAEDVKTVFEWATERYGLKPVFIYGFSMGAVAVMRAASIYQLKTDGIIIGTPFGSLKKAIANHYKSMGIPSFPFADLLTLNIGLINGYWGFDNNPEEFAKNIHVPTLLMYGLNDDRISPEEILVIYENLKGPKHLELYPDTGHEPFSRKNPSQWKAVVWQFLEHPEIVTSSSSQNPLQ